MISFRQRLAMRGTMLGHIVFGQAWPAHTGAAHMRLGLLLIGLLAGIAGGCTPTVKLATDEPITINLNVNIKHEILVKVERDIDDLFAKESELF